MIFYAFFMLYKVNVCSQFIDYMQVPSSYLSIYHKYKYLLDKIGYI